MSASDAMLNPMYKIATDFRSIHKPTASIEKITIAKGRSQSRCETGVGYRLTMAETVKII